jgi:signal transduction histidine kinase
VAVAPHGAGEAQPIRVSGDVLPDVPGEAAFEVRHQGELLGALSVAMPANDPMNPSKERLARDLAGQAGLVLRNVRLIEELRASRRRIVHAQDERARKLERDIHDGAQQQLVALAVQLRLARTMIERDPEQAGVLIERLAGAAGDALDDLRDLARGIYPPLLADKGLVAAVEAQARKAAMPVEVHASDVGRYSEAVEATVYFCTLEALNNVAKYAQASSVSVDLSRTDGRLLFTIRDDGAGFDAATTARGSGLQGMTDRVEAVGGTIEVESAPGHGTTVRGSVPARG